MPIYYVVTKLEVMPPLYFSVYQIIQVIECNMEDIHPMFQKHVAPLIDRGVNVQPLIFEREPNNPFRSYSGLDS